MPARKDTRDLTGRRKSKGRTRSEREIPQLTHRDARDHLDAQRSERTRREEEVNSKNRSQQLLASSHQPSCRAQNKGKS